MVFGMWISENYILNNNVIIYCRSSALSLAHRKIFLSSYAYWQVIVTTIMDRSKSLGLRFKPHPPRFVEIAHLTRLFVKGETETSSKSYCGKARFGRSLVIHSQTVAHYFAFKHMRYSTRYFHYCKKIKRKIYFAKFLFSNLCFKFLMKNTHLLVKLSHIGYLLFVK